MWSKLGARLALATVCCLALVLGMLTQPTKAADYETVPVTGVPDAYIFRHKDQLAFFVVTTDGVVVTDPMSHKSPGTAAKYLAEIKKITSNPIKYVIYSHSDPERSGGGQLFKDEGAKFVAHAQAKKLLEKQKLDDPASFDTVMPDQTVDKGTPFEFDLGGKKFIVKDVGRNYSNDMLVVLLKTDKVLFAVDFIPLKTLPAGKMERSWIPDWEVSLKTVYDDPDWDKLVLGSRYGGVGEASKSDVQALRDYFTALKAEVKNRVDDCWTVAMHEITLPAFANWGNYKDLPGNVERYCYYWTADPK
ncbi:MBL fold metallo-hydrolase [Mesorhizobium sp. M1348]|uniref:MBL fold metallo-hydrolase n=1 Tax=unclassified Mesorhizobium TaxID=325217 RepID=UPI0033393E65